MMKDNFKHMCLYFSLQIIHLDILHNIFDFLHLQKFLLDNFQHKYLNLYLNNKKYLCIFIHNVSLKGQTIDPKDIKVYIITNLYHNNDILSHKHHLSHNSHIHIIYNNNASLNYFMK